MSKTYTFSEAQQLLSVDPKTFRKWVEKAGIDVTKQVSTLDERIKFLTEAQLNKLAKDHARDITNTVVEAQDAGLVGKLKLLTERVDTLEAQQHVNPDQLDDWLKDFAARLDQLEHKYTQQLTQLTDALIAVKELRDWQQAQESKPKPGRKRKAQEGEDEAAQAD